MLCEFSSNFFNAYNLQVIKGRLKIWQIMAQRLKKNYIPLQMLIMASNCEK